MSSDQATSDEESARQTFAQFTHWDGYWRAVLHTIASADDPIPVTQATLEAAALFDSLRLTNAEWNGTWRGVANPLSWTHSLKGDDYNHLVDALVRRALSRKDEPLLHVIMIALGQSYSAATIRPALGILDRAVNGRDWELAYLAVLCVENGLFDHAVDSAIRRAVARRAARLLPVAEGRIDGSSPDWQRSELAHLLRYILEFHVRERQI